MTFNAVQVINQTREKAEKRLLRECGLSFMLARQDEDKNRKDLLEIMNLCLIIVDSRSIAMILDDVDDEPGHGIYRLERVVILASFDTFVELIYASFCANAEEKGRSVFGLQDPLLCELCDEGDKTFFWRSRSLEDVDPLLETNEQSFMHAVVWFAHIICGISGGNECGPSDSSQIIK